MPENPIYYAKFGRRAASLSAAFPGLGQFRNKEPLKGTVVIFLFSLATTLLLLLMSRSHPNVTQGQIRLLMVLPALIWGVSIYDAYHRAIEQRKRHSTRLNLQLVTTIRGYDINQDSFEEITMTKNLSQTGACFILSRMMNQGTQVSLEFEGRERVPGRVVWAQKAGIQEHLVGMELLTPLKQLH